MEFNSYLYKTLKWRPYFRGFHVTSTLNRSVIKGQGQMQQSDAKSLENAEPRHLQSICFLPRNISWKRTLICLCGLESHINHVGSPAHAHRRRHTCHWSQRCRHGSHPLSPRDHNSIPGHLCPWRHLAHLSHCLCTAESQEFTFCLACTLLPSLISSTKQTKPLY